MAGPTFVVLGLVAGFAYGLLHEVADTSTALDYALFAVFLVTATVVSMATHARAGASYLWAVPMVWLTLCGAVLGEFAPFALQLGNRTIDGYGQDSLWEVRLTAWLIGFSILGIMVGVATALIALLASLALEFRMRDTS